MKNLLLTFILLFTSFNLSAQTKSPLSLDSPPTLTPSFSAILCTQIDTTLHWYTNTLGFQIVNETKLPERGIHMANLKRGEMALELIQTATVHKQTDLTEGKGKKARIAGFFKLGFQVDQFDQWIKMLGEKKANFHGEVVNDPVSGKRMVIVLDPEGNRIQFFEG